MESRDLFKVCDSLRGICDVNLSMIMFEGVFIFFFTFCNSFFLFITSETAFIESFGRRKTVFVFIIIDNIRALA